MIKNSELLRKEYNKNYSETIDKWSCDDINTAQKYVSQVLAQLHSYGFQYGEGMKLLDVGCAKGYITEAFNLSGFKAYGLDYSDVAIQYAIATFPNCNFIHMDGFKPSLQESFDIIFCRGFSGANTHNLNFVYRWIERYLYFLNTGGFFILAYSSNFSGREKSGETVNWDMIEIEELIKRISVTALPLFFIPKRSLIRNLKKTFKRILGLQSKDYFYLTFKK